MTVTMPTGLVLTNISNGLIRQEYVLPLTQQSHPGSNRATNDRHGHRPTSATTANAKRLSATATSKDPAAAAAFVAAAAAAAAGAGAGAGGSGVGGEGVTLGASGEGGAVEGEAFNGLTVDSYSLAFVPAAAREETRCV
jgi:hypothetical protein